MEIEPPADLWEGISIVLVYTAVMGLFLFMIISFYILKEWVALIIIFGVSDIGLMVMIYKVLNGELE